MMSVLPDLVFPYDPWHLGMLIIVHVCPLSWFLSLLSKAPSLVSVVGLMFGWVVLFCVLALSFLGFVLLVNGALRSTLVEVGLRVGLA